jgi:transcriptional repressor NrdR
MVKVVKRDGREEEFIPENIVVSVLKAGAPVDVAGRIARKVECMVMERVNVTAKGLTRYILAELKKVNEEWYRNWIVFDQAVKRRRTEEELM